MTPPPRPSVRGHFRGGERSDGQRWVATFTVSGGGGPFLEGKGGVRLVRSAPRVGGGGASSLARAASFLSAAVPRGHVHTALEPRGTTGQAEATAARWGRPLFAPWAARGTCRPREPASPAGRAAEALWGRVGGGGGVLGKAADLTISPPPTIPPRGLICPCPEMERKRRPLDLQARQRHSSDRVAVDIKTRARNTPA
ncbi:unnamed protein product [Lampetra fluviatilis]